MNLARGVGGYISGLRFDDCVEAHRSANPDWSQPRAAKECWHHVNTADGAANVTLMFLGWIPASLYVLFFNQRRKRKRQKEKGIGFGGIVYRMAGVAVLLLMIANSA